MAFQFHEATCVIVGTFNIYIIRPDWLGKIGLLPEGSEIRLESQLDQPGFRLSSPKLGARWVVSPNRLVLETKNPIEDCGQTADRILEYLPWTPLTALGANVVWRGDAANIETWPHKSRFPPSQVPEEFKVTQRSWHIAVKRDEQVFNLQVSEVEEGVEIRANVHTDLRNKDIDFARETARQFLCQRETCISLIRELFNARIEDGIIDK